MRTMMIFAWFARRNPDDGQAYAHRFKETLGSHVTCSFASTLAAAGASLQAVRKKRKGFAYGDESESPTPSQTSTHGTELGGFPACRELASPTPQCHTWS